VQDLIAKAATLLEALPYIQKFAGTTFVVKYGGSFMDSPDPAVRDGVARDVVFLEAVEVNPVVVHGGGKAITRAMEAAGLKASFIQGQRVTDEATVAVVEQVLSREINPEVVATINQLGGVAQGFAGSDIFTCRKLWLTGPDGAKLDIGFVGEVTAVALKAKRLVFMSDVPGLMRDPKDPSTVIAHLQSSEVPGLKAAGIVDKGMIPKVDSAVAALRAGVDKVSFVDGRTPHSVLLEIFTDAGVGTEVVL